MRNLNSSSANNTTNNVIDRNRQAFACQVDNDNSNSCSSKWIIDSGCSSHFLMILDY